MALTRSSNLIVDQEANPIDMAPLRSSHGRIRFAGATVKSETADAAGAWYPMFRMSAHDSIKSLISWNDIIGGGTGVTIGLYAIPDDGGAVIDVDAYAAALTWTSALGPVEHAFNARDHTAVNNRLWEDAGNTVAVNGEPPAGLRYDVVVTIAGNPATADADITLMCEYTSGD